MGQHTSNMSDEKSWLILEYGSGTINAGLSGTSDDPADAPTSMFRTCIGRPNYELSIGADDKAQYLFDAALVAYVTRCHQRLWHSSSRHAGDLERLHRRNSEGSSSIRPRESRGLRHRRHYPF